MKLKDQVAIITGGGRNIGKAMARLFAAEGAKIVVAEIHEGRGQAVVDDINRAGQEAMLVLCDVAKASDVQQLVEKVVSRFGGIDILVNNAALTDHATILDSADRGEPQGPLSGHQVRRGADGQARPGRKNRQFRVDYGHDRTGGWDRLFGCQSRGD